MGLFRHGTLWLGKAGMEGHRVVRLDVVCYVIVGLGVSGFAWFGSVGRAWCGSSSYGVFRCVLAWQARFGSSWSGSARHGSVRQARRVPARLGVVR